jgi:hypothetical protein
MTAIMVAMTPRPLIMALAGTSWLSRMSVGSKADRAGENVAAKTPTNRSGMKGPTALNGAKRARRKPKLSMMAARMRSAAIMRPRRGSQSAIMPVMGPRKKKGSMNMKVIMAWSRVSRSEWRASMDLRMAISEMWSPMALMP